MFQWLFIYVFISQSEFKKRLWIPQKVVVERMKERGGGGEGDAAVFT
jgi:hypothetical protein